MVEMSPKKPGDFLNNTRYNTHGLHTNSFSETNNRGTVCGNSARTDLWGSGEATNRSTRNAQILQSGLLVYARLPRCRTMSIIMSNYYTLLKII